MRAICKITDITHEDLVNLFCCAVEGNSAFYIRMDREEYEKYFPNWKRGEKCREDRWADMLLAGGSVRFYDYYAEDKDDFYGTLPHTWAEDGTMYYTVTLKDIEDALSKALSSGEYIADYVRHLMSEPEQVDLIEGYALAQYIMFGEEIYG